MHANDAGVFLLESPIQAYGWGSRRALAELQGRSVPSPEPEAELWMGAHPNAPSLALKQSGKFSLLKLIAESPIELLGPRSATEYDGQLPFLFKVLAVAQPLSIQAHPSTEQARDGFAKEEAAGVPRAAPTRNYKDVNHKPELVCALTDFHALCGFKARVAALALFDALDASELEPSLSVLREASEDRAVHQLLRAWLTLPRAESGRLLKAVETHLRRLAGKRGEFSVDCEWAMRLLENQPDDPGVLVALLLRHVHLRPGEAMFISAGILHAYLDGTAVEVMANSDNVLRGGLTSKHTDVDELLRILGPVGNLGRQIIPQWKSPELIYRTPAREFELSRFEVRDAAIGFPRRSAEILLCVDGELGILVAGSKLVIERGQAAFISPHSTEYRIDGCGSAFRVVVPSTD